MYEIQKGLPVPKPNRGGPGTGRPAKYPFRQMEVGDSFLIPLRPNGDYMGLGTTVSYATKQTGFKFTTRREPTGTRVWRVK